MYYKKFFTGSVDATTTTNRYYMGLDKIATSTSLGSGHIKNRSDVIGNAIVSTLKDVGYPNAYWDSTSGYVFFDKSNNLGGFYLSVQSSYLYVNACARATSYIGTKTSGSGYLSTSFSGATNSPFSTASTYAGSYQFYVTVKGEPKGIMFLSIGTYNNPSGETLTFCICRGKDKRNNSDTIGFYLQGSTKISTFYFANFSTSEEIVETSLISSNRLTMKNQLVVLIPSFMFYGFLFLDNTYFNPGLTTNGFYKIGDDTYYVDDYWMTKCITAV